MNIIGGLDSATGGSVSVLGNSMDNTSHNERAIIRRKHMGFIFQSYNLLPVYTVYENVELPLVLNNMEKAEREKKVIQAVEWVGLKDKINSKLITGDQIKDEVLDLKLNQDAILATFNDYLGSKIKYEDDLEFLGKLVKDPNANIIKLPNISASIPQLKMAINELQGQGYDIPNYPEKVENDNDLIIKSIYDKIKGSAVNPVLREGNSDRRVPKAVKNYIKSNPHKLGKWTKDSSTHVSSMNQGDFRNNETSLTSDKHELLNIYHYCLLSTSDAAD